MRGNFRSELPSEREEKRIRITGTNVGCISVKKVSEGIEKNEKRRMFMRINSKVP